MNIIFLDWPCFCKEDTVATLKKLGHSVSFFSHPEYDLRKSAVFDDAFDQFCRSGNFDLVFSYNFYPLVSEGCKRNHLKYISIVYDSPHVSLYSYTIVYPCNNVFLFDRTQYQELSSLGITTVHYMPLAANTDRITMLLSRPHKRERYQSDISFVGSLYNEDHNLFDRLSGLSEYTRGYLEAIMEAQLKVYGYPLRLYTINSSYHAPGIENMGTVDYENEMPYVFHYSKINLNITLKSIKSGIPLRAIDIMAAGGFLLSNFQADFLEHFTPDEDFVYYNDLDDLNDKIQYYLNHDEEREQIAKNGQEKIRRYHSFEDQFRRMICL